MRAVLCDFGTLYSRIFIFNRGRLKKTIHIRRRIQKDTFAFCVRIKQGDTRIDRHDLLHNNWSQSQNGTNLLITRIDLCEEHTSLRQKYFERIMFRLAFSSLLLAFLSVSVTLAQNTSFQEYLATTESLSTLNSLITATGLNLTGTGSTVFAPTDDAFAKVDARLLGLLGQPGWSQHLINVLGMHIFLGGALASTDLMDGNEVEALNDETLSVAIGNGTVSVSSPNTNNSLVVSADNFVVEGVVHQVDQVLLPQFVSTDLFSLAGSGDFSILAELLASTDLAGGLVQGLVVTVFAPTDDAFMALGEEALDYYRNNTEILSLLLGGHVLVSTVLPTREMVVGDVANKTAAGTTLTVSIDELDGISLYSINNATIAFPDVLANNGIIHGISSVLSVPGTEYPPPTTPTGPTAPTAPSAPTGPTAPTAKPPSAPTANPPTAPSSDAFVYGPLAAFVTTLLGFFVMA